MLKDILSGRQSITSGRGVVVPRINDWLATRDYSKPPLFRQWVQQQADDGERAPDGWFHPSATAGFFCPRAWVIEQHQIGEWDENAPEAPDLKMMRIFATGRAFHNLVQMWLAQMGILYGLWYPVDSERGRWDVSANIAKETDGQPWRFAEVPMQHKGIRLIGHDDGEVLLPDERWLVEIKSCHDYFYKSVRQQPMEKHREQAVQYVWLRKQPEGRWPNEPLDLPPLKGAVIIYVNKNTSSMVEHVVRLTKGARRDIIEPKLDAYKEALAYNPKKLSTMPKRICEKPLEGKHVHCPVVGACFALPPTYRKRQGSLYA